MRNEKGWVDTFVSAWLTELHRGMSPGLAITLARIHADVAHPKINLVACAA